MNLPLFGKTVGRGGVTLALAGTLALCAACGGGGGTEGSTSPDAGASPAVSGEVQVTEEEAVAEAEAPTATPTPERRVPQVRSVGRVRDPFVNPTAATVEAATEVPAPSAAPAQAGTRPQDKAAGVAGAAGAAGATGYPTLFKKPAKPVVPQPDVAVTGILRSPAGNRAILAGPEGSEIVVVGQKVGEFRVAGIDAKGVTLSWKEHRIQVPFEREVFSLKGSPASNKTDGQGKARTRPSLSGDRR